MRGIWLRTLPGDTSPSGAVHELTEAAFATAFIPASDVREVRSDGPMSTVRDRRGRQYRVRGSVAAIADVLAGRRAPGPRRWPRPQATELVLPAA